MDERENNSIINLSAADGIPKVSFGTSSADQTHLMPEHYDIDGNDVTAYYDGAHKLVFVLDATISEDKPNVLLIINPIGDRKWDDILANDYNVDLETVRPKKDNKYQKLDIEYSGLSVYNKLINEYKSGENLRDAIAQLDAFRDASIRRAAADRLTASNETIVKTRETISKTGETIRELQAKLKKLREKLAKQKKEVGKEPTKQSASKILKTESQIDVTNDKLKRARKRLVNAQRRLEAAIEDADIARHILERPMDEVEIIEEIKEKPKANNMAEEVKPLFDQDPEILDEKIAFKPIEFNTVPQQQSELVEPVREDVFKPIEINTVPYQQPVEPVREDVFKPIEVPPAPLSFTPPTAVQQPEPQPTYTAEGIRDTSPHVNYTDEGYPDVAPVIYSDPTNTPVLETITSVEPVPVYEPAPAPIPTPAPALQPVAPVEARPVSPISGQSVSVQVENKRGKPTALYYIMLIVLIVLSVFTLWLYQKKTGVTIPELVAPTTKPEIIAPPAPAPTPVAEPTPVAVAPVVESPFVAIEPVTEPSVETESEPVYVPAEPEYVREVEIPVQPEPEHVVEEESSWIIAEPAYKVAASAPTPVPVAKPVVVNKPAYNVGGERDEIFVADSDYETEYYPAPTQQPSVGVMCDDGTAPDAYGCCSGEIFTEMDDGGMACCPVAGGTCYPPI